MRAQTQLRVDLTVLGAWGRAPEAVSEADSLRRMGWGRRGSVRTDAVSGVVG